MGVFAYTITTEKVMDAAVNLGTADLRVKVLMSNTNAGTLKDAVNLAALTLDEYDGAGYTQLDLAAIMTTRVDASDRSQLDADDGSFGATVAAGTRPIKALLIYVRVDGTAANDWPLVYDDTPVVFASGTYNGDGGPLSVAFDTTGFLHIAA